MSRWNRTLLLTAAAALTPFQAQALGLGEIEVQSGLNQPFQAVIPVLSGSSADIASTHIRLRPGGNPPPGSLIEHIVQGLIARPVVGPDGQLRIELRGREAVREPALSLVVEASDTVSQVAREYQVLLDPPEHIMQRLLVVEAQSAQAPATPQPRPARATAAEGKALRPEAAPTPPPVQQTLTEYGPVRPNETLYGIASRLRHQTGLSIAEMSDALFRANPHAFIRGDANRLRVNVMLRVPDAASSGLAKRSEQPRNVAATETPAPAKQTESVVLRRTQAAVGAADEQGAALRERLARLEANIEALRAHLASRESQIAELRVQLGGASTTAETAEVVGAPGDTILAAAPTAAAMADAVAADPITTDAPAPAEASEAAVRTGGAGAPAEADAVATAPDVAQDAIGATPAEVQILPDAVAAETPGETAATVAGVDAAPEPVAGETTDAQPQAPAAVTPAPVATDAAPAEEGWLDRAAHAAVSLGLMPLFLGAAAVLLIIGVLIGARLSRRVHTARALETFRQQEAQKRMQVAEKAVERLRREREQSTLFDAADGESLLDTITDHAPATSAEASREDKLQGLLREVDVHIAYGHYEAAKDALEKAIDDDPENQELKVKLAEVCFYADDEAGFLEIAAELRPRVEHRGSDIWPRMMRMGSELCPDNPMFRVLELEPPSQPERAQDPMYNVHEFPRRRA